MSACRERFIDLDCLLVMHLCYSANMHPVSSFTGALQALEEISLPVLKSLTAEKHIEKGVGLWLSDAMLKGLAPSFLKEWLEEKKLTVRTFNGFPYGAFHRQRVKEKVYLPDWSHPKRLAFTNNLLGLLATWIPPGEEGSVSSVPGSFKEFTTQRERIFYHLERCSLFAEKLSNERGIDLHVGLEPEPLGLFDNTEDSIAFFKEFFAFCSEEAIGRRRIGVTYDTCHFALMDERPEESLARFAQEGIRVSKIQLSNALGLWARAHEEIAACLQLYDEPTYLHQVVAFFGRKNTRSRRIYRDIAPFLQSLQSGSQGLEKLLIHFHIPLDREPQSPFFSTSKAIEQTLAYSKAHPGICNHYEVETYTWDVLSSQGGRSLSQQIASEMHWVLQKLG